MVCQLQRDRLVGLRNQQLNIIIIYEVLYDAHEHYTVKNGV